MVALPLRRDTVWTSACFLSHPSCFAFLFYRWIEEGYIWKGRPPKISHYHVFCELLYILRVGCPWRDLPACYGNWNHIYQRFKRGSDRGVWWRILITLQQHKKLRMNVVLVDSTTP